MIKSNFIKVLVSSLTAVIILGTATVVKADTTNESVTLEELRVAYEEALAKENEIGNADAEAAALKEAKEAYDLYENLKSTDLFAAYQNMIAKANKITKVYTVSEKSAFGFGDEQASQEYWTVARKFFLSYLNYIFADKENIQISGVKDRDGGYEKNAGVNQGAYKHYVSVKYTENGETVERFFNYHTVDKAGNVAIYEKYWIEATDEVVAHWVEEVFATSYFFAVSEDELLANLEAAQSAYDAKVAAIEAVKAELASLETEIEDAEAAAKAEEERLAAEAAAKAEEERLAAIAAEEANKVETVNEAVSEEIVVETVKDELVPIELAPMFEKDTDEVATVKETPVVAAVETKEVKTEVAPIVETVVAEEAKEEVAPVETVAAEEVKEEVAPVVETTPVVEAVADEEVAQGQAVVVETVADEVKADVLQGTAVVADTVDTEKQVETLSDEMVPEASLDAASSLLWLLFLVAAVAGCAAVTTAKKRLA